MLLIIDRASDAVLGKPLVIVRHAIRCTQLNFLTLTEEDDRV